MGGGAFKIVELLLKQNQISYAKVHPFNLLEPDTVLIYYYIRGKLTKDTNGMARFQLR